MRYLTIHDIKDKKPCLGLLTHFNTSKTFYGNFYVLYVNIDAFFKWYMYKYGSTYIKVFQRLIHFYKKQLISILMISVFMMRNVIINYKLLYFHYLLIWIQVLVFFLHPIMHCKSNAGHLLSQNHQRTERRKSER